MLAYLEIHSGESLLLCDGQAICHGYALPHLHPLPPTHTHTHTQPPPHTHTPQPTLKGLREHWKADAWFSKLPLEWLQLGCDVIPSQPRPTSKTGWRIKIRHRQENMFKRFPEQIELIKLITPHTGFLLCLQDFFSSCFQDSVNLDLQTDKHENTE